MKLITNSAVLLLFIFYFSLYQTVQAKTIFVAPSGNGNGSDELHPSGSLNNAVASLNPGDTLIFLDGVYHQTLSISNKSGTQEKPVVLMAKHAGSVLINADTARTNAVYIDHVSYMKIDGIEGGNSLHHAWRVLSSSYLTLTRCAGFNAGYLQAIDGHALDTYDDNCHVFSIAYSDHILAEDIWGWGTGRYVFAYFQCSNSIIRRGVFRADLYDRAPHAGMNVYDCVNCIAENVIAFGTRFHLQSDYYADNPWGLVQGGMVFDDHTFPADANRILGCFDLDNGNWRTELPRSNPAIHVMSHWHGSFEDMVIWKNALDYGFVLSTDQEVKLPERALIGSPSKIKQETGPYVNNRYVDGILTTQPLWPWPNEELIKRDLGMDKTITEYVRDMLSPNLSINNNQADGVVTSVQIDSAKVSLSPGDSLVLHYSLLPSDALYPEVKWTSANEKVVTVSAKGTITAISPGETIVRVRSTDSGLSDACEVTVADPETGAGTVRIEQRIRIYPNPVHGMLILDIPEGMKSNITMVNPAGKIFQSIATSGGVITISTLEYPPGIYFVSVTGECISYHSMVVVE